MPPLELWIAFVAASAALFAIPGPTVALVVAQALGNGRSSARAMVRGVVLGDFVAMTLSLLGVGAVLAASATLFTALKLVGAAYLILLGIRLWRAEPRLAELQDAPIAGSDPSVFWSAFVVTALNPKSIMFFVAFVPQFVDPEAPVVLQFIILEATFLAMSAASVVIWAGLAGHLRSRVSRPETLKLLNRIGAGFLIGAGLLAGAVRRGA